MFPVHKLGTVNFVQGSFSYILKNLHHFFGATSVIRSIFQSIKLVDKNLSKNDDTLKKLNELIKSPPVFEKQNEEDPFL